MQHFKNFSYQEDGNLYHEGNRYDVNKNLQLASTKKSALTNTEDLKWMLDSVPEDEVDYKRVRKANTKYPVILTDYQDKKLIIDGFHRTKKSYKRGDKQIKSVYLTPEEFESTRVNDDA